MTKLLNVDKALALVLNDLQRCSAENVFLADAMDRVLARDIAANIDLPPFDNSAMDGYAVRAADVAGASPEHPVTLRVTMDIPAGVAPERPLEAGEAARIMTGAPVPDGADAVVPVEDTDGDWSQEAASAAPQQVRIFRAVQAGAAIRPIGENIRRGQTVLRAGDHLKAAHIGVLASLGIVEIPVIRRPRVAILSTGNELVDVNEPLTPGKIRNVNSYTLAALIQEHGGDAIRLPTAGDTLPEIRAMFDNALSQRPDLIVSSAGVSVGAADYIRTVLEELGKVGFWRINLRPGKPLAFGSVQGVPFFGLPGNPVSAMVTFDVFVRPALLKIAGRPDNAVYDIARTGEHMTSDGRRSYLRVRLQRDPEGQLIAYETGTQSSGALLSMVLADGLLIIPEDIMEIEAGTPLTVRLLRRVE